MFGDLPPLHGETELAGGAGVFGDEHSAAGLAVESIDDGNLAAIGDFVGEKAAQAVPEGFHAAGGAGVDFEWGGFVHNDVVFRLIEDGEFGVVGDGGI